MSAKYIFVTGGVVSSLGKGLTAPRSACCSKIAGFASACRSSTPTSTSIPAP